MEIGLAGRCAPRVGLRRREKAFGRRRPAIGRTPLEVEFIRRPPRWASASRAVWKSASRGASRRASAFADARSLLARGFFMSNAFDPRALPGGPQSVQNGPYGLRGQGWVLDQGEVVLHVGGPAHAD